MARRRPPITTDSRPLYDFALPGYAVMNHAQQQGLTTRYPRKPGLAARCPVALRGTVAALGRGFSRMAAARARAEAGRLPFRECTRCNIWRLLPNNFCWTEGHWHRRGHTLRRAALAD